MDKRGKSSNCGDDDSCAGVGKSAGKYSGVSAGADCVSPEVPAPSDGSAAEASVAYDE